MIRFVTLLAPLCLPFLLVAAGGDDVEVVGRLVEKARRAVLSGDHAEALQRYHTITRLLPRADTAAAAWWEIARIEERLGNAQEAFDALQALVTTQPGHFEKAHAEQFRLARGILDQMEERARKAGLTPGRSKKLEAADREALTEMLRTICRNGPQTEVAAQSHFTLGVLLEREGELEKALEQHEEFLELYPDHEMADDAACQTAYIRFKQWKEMQGAAPRQRARAADALTWFLGRYPESERASLARSCLAELKGSEKKELETLARFYEGQGKKEAAAIYRKELREKFPEDKIGP